MKEKIIETYRKLYRENEKDLKARQEIKKYIYSLTKFSRPERNTIWKRIWKR